MDRLVGIIDGASREANADLPLQRTELLDAGRGEQLRHGGGDLLANAVRSCRDIDRAAP